jgi:hypothetical protein
MEANQMKKRNVFKVLALLCALVLIIGSIPVMAKTKIKVDSEGKVVVKNNKQYKAALKNPDVKTIFYQYSGKKTLVFKHNDKTNEKTLIVKAKKAKVVNYADWDGVVAAGVKKFIEKGSENDITVTGKTVVQVTIGGVVSSITITTKKAVKVIVNEDGVVEDIIVDRAGVQVEVAAQENAEAVIELVKKAILTVSGDNSSDVEVINTAEGSEIIANAQVDKITTTQDMKATLGANADGTVIDKVSDVIDIILNNPFGTEIIKELGGEVVEDWLQVVGSGSAIKFNQTQTAE